MMPAITTLAGWIVERLAAGSIQAIVLVVLAWLACRRRVRLSPAMQATLWWAVLLKVVLLFAPLPSVSVPILPADTATSSVTAVPSPNGVMPPLRSVDAVAVRDNGSRWILLAAGLWLLGVCWHAAQMLRSFRTTRAMVRGSVVAFDADELPGSLAATIGLSTTPQVRIAEEASAPLVVGVWRPTVLMPAMASLSHDDRRMALGHEFMHVKRRDLVLAWIPAVAERLFFFHPLVRLAAREYVTAREAACDAALIRALGVAPDRYGQLLVRFGITGQRLAWSAGGASGSGAVLRRRLDMLQHLSSHSRRAAWLVAALIAVAIVPSHLVARTTVPSVTPSVMVAADVNLPPALPRNPAAAPAPHRQAGPQAAPEPAPQPLPESVRTPDFLRDQIVELEKQLRAAQAAAANAQDDQSEQLRRELEKIQKLDLEKLSKAYEPQLNRYDAQADSANAQAARAERMAREFERAQELDAGRQQELAKRYQDMADVVATRQDYVKQRLVELSQRLQELAALQQRLQMEAEQLKIELNAR